MSAGIGRCATRLVRLVVAGGLALSVVVVIESARSSAAASRYEPRPLFAALLNEDQLPPGWRVTYTGGGSGVSPADARQEIRDCGAGNVTGLQSITVGNRRVNSRVASAGYMKGGYGPETPTAHVTAWRYRTARLAHGALAAERSFLRRCATVTFPDWDDAAQANVGPPVTFQRSFSEGNLRGTDEALVIEVTEQFPTYSARAHLVEFRRGRAIVTVGSGGATAVADPAITDEFVRRVLRRLSGTDSRR
jgi:hypothetical protein